MTPRYIVTVYERIVQECEYEIKANDAAEAKLLAANGIYESREVIHPGREIEPQRDVHDVREQEQDE
jgi:hypothetical protein